MKRRFLCILMSVVMTVLCGCGSSESRDNDSDAAENPVNPFVGKWETYDRLQAGNSMKQTIEIQYETPICGAYQIEIREDNTVSYRNLGDLGFKEDTWEMRDGQLHIVGLTGDEDRSFTLSDDGKTLRSTLPEVTATDTTRQEIVDLMEKVDELNTSPETRKGAMKTTALLIDIDVSMYLIDRLVDGEYTPTYAYISFAVNDPIEGEYADIQKVAVDSVKSHNIYSGYIELIITDRSLTSTRFYEESRPVGVYGEYTS